MRAGLIATVAGMAMLLALAAGCSAKKDGTALPVTTTTATETTDTQTPDPTTPSTSTGGAPRVASPIDATRFLPQPCTALSAAALQGLNISKPGEPDTDSAIAKSSGPYCTWTSSGQPQSRVYNVGFLTGNKNGLSDTYRGGKKAFPGYFEPAEVDGYPAVYNGLTENRPSGACNITVGISDTLAFRAGVEAGRATGTQACDIVKQVASSVIKTLKGA